MESVCFFTKSIKLFSVAEAGNKAQVRLYNNMFYVATQIYSESVTVYLNAAISDNKK